jgi:hypothetical protein
VSLKILAGLCNTGAGREIHMNLMRPQGPNLHYFLVLYHLGGFCQKAHEPSTVCFFAKPEKNTGEVIFARKVFKTK